MEQKLINSDSLHADLILELVQNSQRISGSVFVDEEDVLLTSFVEPLIMPFLRNIQSTTVHGNGRPLHESYIRKAKITRKYGLYRKNIRGRAPDRSVTLRMPSGEEFTFLVVEVKTAANAEKHPDFTKLATLMKDVLDFASSKEVTNYFTIGILVAGASCKVYKLHMPINRMYCMTEVAAFLLPNNADDILLNNKLQNIVVSMLQCRRLIDEAIALLQRQVEPSSGEPSSSTLSVTVDSYPSPPHHYSYFK